MELQLLTIYTLLDNGASYRIFYDDENPIKLGAFTYSAQRMGTTTLTATLKFPVCLDSEWTGMEFVVLNEAGLTGNDTVLSLEKFFLLHKPGSTKSNTDERYEHTLEFQSERDITLNSVYFCDSVSGTADKFQSNNFNVTFYGTLTEFVGRFTAVLQKMGLSSRFSITIDSGVTADVVKEVSFEKQTLFEVLQTIFNVYEVPFYFDGNAIHLGEGSNPVAQVNFEYGTDKSLLSVKKTNTGSKIVTRCTGYGSDENIPYYYPNPTPKGTLKIGSSSTATGVSITNQLKYSSYVKLGGVLTYKGTGASNKQYGIDYFQNKGNTTVAGTLVPPTTSGTPFGVYASFGLNGGYRGKVRINLDFDGGSVTSRSDSNLCALLNGEVYRTHTVSDVGAKAFNIKVNKVRVTVSCTDSSTVTAELEDYMTVTAMADSGLKTAFDWGFPYESERLKAVELDMATVVARFGEMSLGHTPDFTNGTVRIDVLCRVSTVTDWRSVSGSTVSPTFFTAASLTVEGEWDDGGWENEGICHELSYYGLSQAGTPSVGNTIVQDKDKYVNPSQYLLPKIYRDTDGAVRFLNASDDEYVAYTDESGNQVKRGHYEIPGTSPTEYYSFDNQYNSLSPREHIEEFSDIKVTLSNSGTAVIAGVGFDDGYNINDTDSDGNLRYDRFFLKIGNLGFNLFDCAIENGDMTINMTSGNCAGCKFKIIVDENTHKNLVQLNADGSLKKDSDGRVVEDKDNPMDVQNDTTSGYVWLKVGLDDETYGGTEVDNGVMPSWNAVTQTGIKPTADASTGVFDSFVLTNILMPDSYYTDAELLLEREIVKFMHENNADTYSYGITFSRIYLAQNHSVRDVLNEHCSLILKYNGTVLPALHVSQFTLKQSEGEALPDISVELTDTIGSTGGGLSEKISAAVGSVVNLVGQGGTEEAEDGKYLRKDIEETVSEKMTFEKGFTVGNGYFLSDTEGNTTLEIDRLKVRRKASFTSVEIEKISSVGGKMVLSLASMKCSAVESVVIDSTVTPNVLGYKCYFDTVADDGESLENGFAVGDLALCQSFSNDNDRYWWRKVVEVGSNYITVSDRSGEYDTGSDAPADGDEIVQFGNVGDTARQSAQVLSCYGDNTPSHTMYAGINSFSLTGKDVYSTAYVKTTYATVTASDTVYQRRSRLDTEISDTDYYGWLNGSAKIYTLSDDPEQNDEYFTISEGTATSGGTLSAVGTVDTYEAKLSDYGSMFFGSRGKSDDYIEYDNETGIFTIKADVVFKSGQDFGDLEYLKTRLKEGGTAVSGGLILTNKIALGSGDPFEIKSGINGVVDTTAKGNGIAAWFGGPMVDKEVDTTASSYAKSLFRFDGSGYLAGGLIKFYEERGTAKVTINNNAVLESGSGSGTTTVGDIVSISEWFEFDSVNNMIKAKFGLYSEQQITAGGVGSGGSGSVVVWGTASGGKQPLTVSNDTRNLMLYPSTEGTTGQVLKKTSTGIAWADESGGSGEPSSYVKSAAVSGNTLTLTNKDNTTVEFTPTTDLSNYYTKSQVYTKAQVDALIPSLTGYLPLSAGSDKKLTGDLYVGASGESKNIYLNGEEVATQDWVEAKGYAVSSDLATVATSGSYDDLSNKPTIPAAQVQSDWDATSGMGVILNKPTNLSDFTNDSGFLTSSDAASTYQTKITSSNKLSADYVDDTNCTNKFVTASEKTSITDLASMFTKESDGSGGYRIKANFGLYSNSFITAGGIGSGSGSTTVSWGTKSGNVRPLSVASVSENLMVYPDGTTGHYLRKTASGIEWAAVSTGVTSYTSLTDKPSVNGVTLSGSMTASDLGLASEDDLENYIPVSSKGAAGGVASLDSNGKVTLAQLPVGDTSSDVCRGDHGEAAYSHSIITSGNPHGVTAAHIGLENVENTALSTWAGSTNITTLGTISAGTWQGTAIADSYVASATNWNAVMTAFNQMFELDTTSVSGKTLIHAKLSLYSDYAITAGGVGNWQISYNSLADKPQIAGVTLEGNKTLAQLGIAAATHSHTVSQITDLETWISNKGYIVNPSYTTGSGDKYLKRNGTTLSWATVSGGGGGTWGSITGTLSDQTDLQAALDAKQDTIGDLETIRTNASAGAAKVSCTESTVAGFGFTKNSGTVTSVAVMMNNTVKGTITSNGTIDLGTVITDISGKQNTISDLSTIRSNAQAGKNASDTITGYGDIVTHDASEFLTEHQSLSAYSTTSQMNAAIAAYHDSTKLDQSDFTQANIKSTLGISDWALATTKPSYNFSEIGSTPTTISGYGITNAYTKSEVDNLIPSLSGYATQVWVEAKGYTTNTGTVTSVAIKMNGATKGTITGSGTIDLGNVVAYSDGYPSSYSSRYINNIEVCVGSYPSSRDSHTLYVLVSS